MFFTVFDLVLLFIIFLLVAYGFWSGFIRALGVVVGILLATWLTGKYYLFFSDWLGNYILSDSETLRNTIAFILLFALIQRAVGFLFAIAEKLFNLVSIIPFTTTINRLFGALLGTFAAVFGLGLILYFISGFGSTPWFSGIIADSRVAQGLIVAGEFFAPMIPELLKYIQNVV